MDNAANHPGAFKRWLYEHGRPGRLAALLNRGWAIVGASGIWAGRLVTLEVRGRKSGRLTTFPVVMCDYQGERYLVSMLGEGANWVANVRAAGGQAVLRHGRRETVRLDEIEARERAPVLRRYLEVAPGARPHIPIDRRAPLEDFQRIAAQFPVFRVRADPRL